MISIRERFVVICMSPFRHSLIYGYSTLFLAANTMIDQAKKPTGADSGMYDAGTVLLVEAYTTCTSNLCSDRL